MCFSNPLSLVNWPKNTLITTMTVDHDSFSLSQASHALVVGGGRGIGLGLVSQLLEQNQELTVFATYRDPARAGDLMGLTEQYLTRLQPIQCDPLDEGHLQQVAQTIRQTCKYVDLVLVAPGILHTAGNAPEKSLRNIDLEQLQEVFRVNAFITPLVAKHMKKLISRSDPSAFIALSAMVGSIEDNALGGWYGYRASKSALNMFLKTISIELKRSGYKTHVGAIHPGTTHTALSSAFVANVAHRVWSPNESADNILEVIDSLDSGETGFFKNWDGTSIPW